mmetsp:Transcript_18869/g.72719  ORF Transcript_18869/g.72719 Transcript_18869/m.72719 type:complete len:219 (-) Transcript_18869:987-1643(-)
MAISSAATSPSNSAVISASSRPPVEPWVPLGTREEMTVPSPSSSPYLKGAVEVLQRLPSFEVPTCTTPTGCGGVWQRRVPGPWNSGRTAMPSKATRAAGVSMKLLPITTTRLPPAGVPSQGITSSIVGTMFVGPLMRVEWETTWMGLDWTKPSSSYSPAGLAERTLRSSNLMKKRLSSVWCDVTWILRRRKAIAVPTQTSMGSSPWRRFGIGSCVSQR